MREARRLGVVALAAVALAACAPAPRDFADADLRVRIDRLKAAVAEQPTSAANLTERLDVLWDWANAYALAGNLLPVNLPQLAGSLRTAASEGAEPTPAQLVELDRYIRELEIKDEHPDALGTVAFATSEPLPAASWQTIEQVWTVGSMGMQPGGVVMVAKQLVTDQGQLQHQDPTADNYVSVVCSNPDASFERITVPWLGMHGGFRGGATPNVAFRLAGAALRQGDTVAVSYGDRSGGSQGFKVQTWSTDRLVLPLYLDLDGSGAFLTPAWPGLEVTGLEAAAVRAVAPSVVGIGEPFELAVRFEDRYSNRATGPIPSYQVLLNGQPFRTIGAGEAAITVLDDLAIEEPGVYRFAVRSDDGSITASSNPLWVHDNPSQRIYWGETHGHTDFAEGQGSPEHYFRWGRDDARVDFLSLSEHDIWMDAREWRTLQELTARYTEPGRFVAFLGYEWSVARDRGGHHNVLFRTPDRKIVGIHRASALPELYRILAEENRPDDVLVIPHAHNAGDWTQNDPELERLVELYSMHGTFEWFANFYLRNGFQVGFIAAADDHRARPGYAVGVPMAPLAQLSGLAAVIAPSNTPEAIFDAMRSLSAYATSGQRIILDASLNGAGMGTRQELAERRDLACRVMGTSPIDHIDVIKNGEVVFSRRYLTAPLEPRSFVLVGFESSSEVFPPPRDNPRGYRPWDGALKVEGARIVSVATPGFDNRYLERAAIDPNDPSLIRFHAETRGRRDTVLLELEGASAATAFALHLEPTREVGMSAGTIRLPADLPTADLRLALSSLVDGRLEHELTLGPHTDRVTVEVVAPEGAQDLDFEYTDLGPAAAGDYYYLRVTQLDGGQAWSSPFWIGRTAE